MRACLLLLLSSFASSQLLTLPGTTVPVLQLLDNYVSSCTTKDKGKIGFSQLSQIVKQFDAHQVATKLYNALFFAIADINIEEMMGKWYTVVDSRSVHQNECTVTYMKMLSKSEYTATFSVTQYSKDGWVNEGYGRKTGPDPGELLISLGHPNDECAYMPVKLGGQRSDSSFDYVILSQPLKHPTMVLARDPHQFAHKYAAEVRMFLEKNGFWSPVYALNARLHFIDHSKCTSSSYDSFHSN